jgi:hypothetical protein
MWKSEIKCVLKDILTILNYTKFKTALLSTL